ncbi:hypothetical protein XM48_07550 [Leucobacter sp. Ag1]|uniref:fibronectin type III domain-containing protein n=1 Tax=Leucobacter sp. Ag1 TaxID=1642040 RepID=UPI0006211F7E|nr:fibronectin type III domain-containing protein [Leucobacter sp. Ag1]KKI20563.1 hypothetical protein XM48_07550 [Leucobacter sp. Ag1]
MAITWGTVAGHFQLGIDAIISGTTATLVVYGRNENGYSHSWNSTLSYGGAWSGSRAISFSSGLAVTTKELVRTSVTFTGTRTYSVSMPIPYWGGTASASRSVTIADPVVPKPTAPRIDRVIRNSDTSHRPEWTRFSTATAVVVQRQSRTSTGPTNDLISAFTQIAKPTGNPANYTDTGTKPNMAYRYRVAAVNAGGQSSWSNEFGWIYTTPNAPTNAKAERSGSNIMVSATAPSVFPLTYDVFDNGTQVATGVALPWTHVNPSNATTHRYTVRAKVVSQAGGVTLTGPQSAASNTVQLPAAPNAPTNLTPNGGLAVDDTRQLLTWQHNPVDSSAQTAANIQYRLVGAPSWTTVTATTAASYLLPLLAVGVYEFQVSTKGGFATYSPYSAVARFTVISRPQVTIDQPVDSWDSPTLPVQWSWFQAEGRPQSSWELQLLDDTGAIRESRSGQGATATVTLNTRLLDGAAYTVKLRAAAGDIQSDWTEAGFVVAFVPPAAPSLIVGWDEPTGAAVITVTQGTDPADAPATATVSLERSVDGGQTWELYAEGLVLASEDPGDLPALTVSDWECRSAGSTLYRATALTAIGASASTEDEMVADSPAIWLSGGNDLSLTARLPYDPEVMIEHGRKRGQHRFAGRSLPVNVVGEQITIQVQFSGSVHDGDEDVASRDLMHELALDPAPVQMYRDPDGTRIHGSVSSIPLTRVVDGEWSYQVTLEGSER